MLSALFALVAGYLLGGLPSAYLVSKLKRENVFEVGSGNMGTMNVARNLGFGLGALVLLLDLSKGALASLLGAQLGGSAAYACGFGAVLGHAYSPYVRLRGGKGLATALGASLPLYPRGGLTALGVLVLLTLILRRRSALAAALLTLFYPFIVWLSLAWTPPRPTGAALLTSVVFIAAVVFIKYLPDVRAEFRSA